MSRSRLYRWGVGLAYAGTSLYVFAMWATDVREFVGLDGYYRARFVDMIYGTAYKPFAYRVLVPWSVRALQAALPSNLLGFLQGDVYTALPVVARATDYLGWQRAYLPEYAIALGLAYLALLSFMLIYRQLALSLYSADAWLIDAAPLVSLLVLPVFFKRGTHMIYDFVVLFLFTAGVLLLLRERWWGYYALLPIAHLNKETTVLLTLIFLIRFYRRFERRRLLAHLFAQGLIFVAIKGALMLAFRDNAGGLFETHLYENIRLYLRPYWFTTVADVVAIVLLVGYRYREKPHFLRQCLWICVPLSGLLFVMGGYAEIRDLYEVYPVAFLLALQTIAWIMGWGMETRSDVSLAADMAE